MIQPGINPRTKNIIIAPINIPNGLIAINPLGMFIGAIIMFFVLGFIPGWIIAKVLHGMGQLRIPREVELAGLDYQILEDASSDEKAVASSTR